MHYSELDISSILTNICQSIFHIENGDGKAKINVATLEVVENHGVKPKDMKKALEIIKLYNEEIIAKWEEYHGEDN